MTIFIGLISQKGGVGKSTISRILAREYALAGYNVKIVDLDIQQQSSYQWQIRRLKQQIEPEISVEIFSTVKKSLKNSSLYDLIIFDGSPHMTQQTLDISNISDILIIPTSTTLDDLHPSVLLANSLIQKKSKIYFALSVVGKSQSQIKAAKQYIKESGNKYFKHVLYKQDNYILTQDSGRTLTETHCKSLAIKANKFTQCIIDALKSKIG